MGNATPLQATAQTSGTSPRLQPPDLADEAAAPKSSKSMGTSVHVEDKATPHRTPPGSRQVTRVMTLSSVPSGQELKTRLSMHFVPETPVGQPPSFWRSLWGIICASCMCRFTVAVNSGIPAYTLYRDPYIPCLHTYISEHILLMWTTFVH